MQGGASAQFSAVPLNLTVEGDTVDQIVTGSWSKKALEEAAKSCNSVCAAKGDNKSIPDPSTWNLSADAKYVHYCDNETIQVNLRVMVAFHCIQTTLLDISIANHWTSHIKHNFPIT